MRSASILYGSFSAQLKAPHPQRAMIGEQIVFLGALAVENGLKGIIMSRTNLFGPLTGKFPEAINGHSLVVLAQTAGFTPQTPVEEDALDHGEDYIEWIGRYPSGLRPESVAAGRSLSPIKLFSAQSDMFHRAVEVVARETSSRGYAPPKFGVDEWIERQRTFYLQLTSPI